MKTADRSIIVDVVELSQLASRFGGKVVEFPGLDFAFGKVVNYLFLRHWLIITVFTAFTAFNITLHFIYRKRPEIQPCEV